MARVVDLETAVDVLGGKIEFESGEEGREREILDAPAAHGDRRDGARAVSRGIDLAPLVARDRDRRHASPPASGSPRRDFLDRAAASSASASCTTRSPSGSARPTDGERASAIELALEGLFLAPQDRQGVRRRERDGLSADDARDARYGRATTAGPDPLAPPVDLAEALDAIGSDVMAGYSPERAMREFLRRGGQNQRGLDDLAAPGRRSGGASCCSEHTSTAPCRRSRSCSTGPCSRSASSWPATLDDDARFAEMQIENLPASHRGRGQRTRRLPLAQPAGARGLRADQGPPRSRAARPAVPGHEAGAGERHRRGPGARSSEMLRDLNELLDAHNAGRGHRAGRSRDFMDKHGEFFPENPQTIEELHRRLAQRAAAAQRMLNSMTQEQRDELDALAAAGVRHRRS